jgi:hypothetical protein
MTPKELKSKKDKEAQRIYHKPYSELCPIRKRVIDLLLKCSDDF